MQTSRDTVYVSDLDGTLLRNDAMLSPYSRNGLQRLLQAGLAFTVASARSVVSMRPILTGITLTLPIIEFNGAFLSDLATGQHVVINSFDSALAAEIYHDIFKRGHRPFISTFNGVEDCVYYAEMLNDGMAWYLVNRQQHRDRRLRPTTDLAVALHDRVVCFNTIGQPEPLAELYAEMQERFASRVNYHYYENAYSPGWYWLEVQPINATKALAIQALIAYAGLHAHELVVFGDHLNDLSMFQIAHRGVAVANARDEVKQCATTIIDSNEADGVVRYLEQEWRTKVFSIDADFLT